MALTGMQIYKTLPRTNCKECGFPTCMAFAMQVAAKKKAVSDCPHVSEDAKSELSDASAPPMKLVKIGTDAKAVEIGQETVMFRHEEKFHRPTVVAVRVPGSASDDEAQACVEKINQLAFERVGEKLRAGLCAVEVEECADPAARARLVAEKADAALMILGNTADKVKAAVEAVKDQKPLVGTADAGNVEALAEICAAAKTPLALTGGTPEEMGDVAAKAKEKGVEEMVLCVPGGKFGDTLRMLTTIRRAALKRGCRGLGYPAMVEVSAESPQDETAFAVSYAAKYAGIVVMNGNEPCQVLPVLTAIQNVYTDPQVPNTVEAKLYEVGSPNENSPVLFTTNFALTYFSVEGEVERSKIPAYICAVETEGLGVLNAYAGDKISAEKVIKALQDQKVADKVKHRKLIIPGLLPIFRAEIEDGSEWKEVIIGPETANKIPAFLNANWK